MTQKQLWFNDTIKPMLVEHELWLNDNTTGKQFVWEGDLDLSGLKLDSLKLYRCVIKGDLSVRYNTVAGYLYVSPNTVKGARFIHSNKIKGIDESMIATIPNINQAIYERVMSEGCKLEMDNWHTSETTHCIAGWAAVLGGQKELEKKLGTATYAYMLFGKNSHNKSSPDFYNYNNAKALEDLKLRAENEKQANQLTFNRLLFNMTQQTQPLSPAEDFMAKTEELLHAVERTQEENVKLTELLRIASDASDENLNLLNLAEKELAQSRDEVKKLKHKLHYMIFVCVAVFATVVLTFFGTWMEQKTKPSSAPVQKNEIKYSDTLSIKQIA